MNFGTWIYNTLVGLDQFANALTGGNADETISGRTGLSTSKFGRLVRGALGLLQRDHSLMAIEYTPWGTADAHSLRPVHQDIAADWNAAMAVILSPRDLDAFPEATKAAANRALIRLAAWEKAGGRGRWAARMWRDFEVGDILSGGIEGAK